MDIDRTLAFADQTPWLHRWFVARGVDPCTADDLVQLTLIEGWRNLHKLETDDGMRPWLTAIARFVLKRWWRSTVRETHAVLSQFPEVTEGIADDCLPEPSRVVEHDELAAIVARALERIPDADRRLLQSRYDEERSVADLADRAGISAAHMAVRLQRVRARVRAALVESGVPGLEAYGFDPLTIGWKPTRLWCPLCNSARLTMRVDPAFGSFSMKCPACNPDPDNYFVYWEAPESRSILVHARSAPQALDRLGRAFVYEVPSLGQSLRCPRCQHPITKRVRVPANREDVLDNHQLEWVCRTCGPLPASSTYRGMAILHPKGRQFWRDHDRVLTMRPVAVRFDQREAVRVELVSATSSERLWFVFAARGEQLLAIGPGR